MGNRPVLGHIEGLADVIQGIWGMTELLWDLSKAWWRYLKVYEGWVSCSETYQKLERGAWRHMKDCRVVLGLIKDLAEVFENIIYIFLYESIMSFYQLILNK